MPTLLIKLRFQRGISRWIVSGAAAAAISQAITGPGKFIQEGARSGPLFGRLALRRSHFSRPAHFSDQLLDFLHRIEAAATRAADFYALSGGPQDDAGFMAINTFHLTEN
jgi:hypothetical protein